MIKAIETHYNGYRFRSRLEARWAVFFDAVGIQYEYEMEGFDFIVATYLPDFYLPRHEIFIEIKPNSILASSQKTKECIDLLETLSMNVKRPALLLAGDPLDHFAMPIMMVDNPVYSKSTKILDPIRLDYFNSLPAAYNKYGPIERRHRLSSRLGFCKNPDCKGLRVVDIHHQHGDVGYHECRDIDGYVDRKDRWTSAQHEVWRQASARARKSRFEHGETPQSSPIKVEMGDPCPFLNDHSNPEV